MNNELRPKRRSALRRFAGTYFYTLKRYIYWYTGGLSFAHEYDDKFLAWKVASHHTPLLRKLKDVDMQYQYNKIVNLKL